MQIIEKKLADLRAYENNPRRNDDAVDAVAESIREFGFKVPIVIDRDGVIVAGHTRARAAEKLGLAKVPCIVADDLDEEQIRAFRLADNKTAELAEWDFQKLELEMCELHTIDLTRFGFDGQSLGRDADWFNRSDRWDDGRQEGNEEYNEFLEQFDNPKTSDDCYTPENIYEVVADFVAKQYGVKRSTFRRPFYPGGDYQAEKYQPTDVVVDNPPFSILAEILDFYTSHGVKFFLFAPMMVSLKHAARRGLTFIPGGQSIIYENKATIPSAFLTNLDPEYVVRISVELYQALKTENQKNLDKFHANLPKYVYPDEIATAARLNYIANYGEALLIRREETTICDALDAQKEAGASIFGGGLLLSEKAAAEKAAAEKAAAKVWPLSDREREIVRSLGTEGR